MPIRHRLDSLVRRSLLGGLLALLAPLAAAWTDKPVKILVPAPPGGSIDVVARLFAEQLQADTGIQAIVEYKPGAGGAIAVQALRSAPADGQTLMLTSSNVLTEIPHAMKTSFDPLKDVRPIATLARGSIVLVCNPALPATDLPGFVAYAKANPGKLSFATYSAGTASHYAGMILNQKAGLDLAHVPFAGSPPALAQVMGGQIALMFDGMATSLPQIRGGKLRALAVASSARSVHLPSVPTTAELGYPDINYGGWFGFIAAAGLPQELADRINAVMNKSAAAPRLAERLAAAGMEPNQPISSAQMAQLIKADYERNAATVKAFDIKLQ